MPEDLATLVDAARARAFVGRAAKLDGFDAALAGQSQCRVLFVHGAGGLGKTALLHQFRTRAQAAGVDVFAIDGEDVDGSPDGLRAAVGSARARMESREGGARGWVLLIDGYDRLGERRRVGPRPASSPPFRPRSSW